MNTSGGSCLHWLINQCCLKLSILQLGIPKVASAQISLPEITSAQIGSIEATVLQDGGMEIGPLKQCKAQICSRKIGVTEVSELIQT